MNTIAPHTPFTLHTWEEVAAYLNRTYSPGKRDVAHQAADHAHTIECGGRTLVCWQGISSRESSKQVLHIATVIISHAELSAEEESLLRSSGINPFSPDIMQLAQEAYSLPLGGIRLIHDVPCLHITAQLPLDTNILDAYLRLAAAQANSLEGVESAESTESTASTADAEAPEETPIEAAQLYEILVTDYRATSTDNVTYEFNVVWRADSDAQVVRASYAHVDGVGNILYVHAPLTFSPTEKTTRIVSRETSRLLEGDIVMDSAELMLRLTLPMRGLTRESLAGTLKNFAGAATALRLDFAGEFDDNLLTFG